MKEYDKKIISFSGDFYFPTIIFSMGLSDHKKLNSSLLGHIYEEYERDKNGINRSNFPGLGGWHSHNALHKNEYFNPLVKIIDFVSRKISSQMGYSPDKFLKIGTMWSIINPPGSANKAHIHPSSHWSGVYYVQTPESSGQIEFTDPRTAHVMNQPDFAAAKKRGRESWTKVNYTPKPGKLIIFPSWLYHAVEPNLSVADGKSANRVIVSFNLTQE
jgi:uncharacterized protein (TIGR02466 family)